MIHKSAQQRRFVALVAAIGLTVAACGTDDGPDAGDTSGSEAAAAAITAADDADHTDDEAEHDEEFNFGEPADAADADRVIEILAKDDFTFDPDVLQITAGETVTFRIENVGKLPHDFTLGDADLQEEHAEEMASMVPTDMEVHDEPNAVVIDAGETKELTWQFTDSVEIIFGCQIPGHYAAGMRGDITVAG